MTTVSVSPTNKNPSHMIKLSASGTDIGLLPVNEATGIQEIPYSPSSLRVTAGGGQYSDFELPYSHIAQSTWAGGRGQDILGDETRFYDSQTAWTTRDGMIVPAPQWCYATGYRNQDANWWYGKNMNWLPLYGANRAQSYYKNASGDAYTGAKFRCWIRRVGTPGTLGCAVWSDSGTPGTPDAALASAGIAASTFPDTASQWYTFNMAYSMVGATLYWFLLYGDVADDASNHWEIGGQTVSASALYKKSADGVSWSNGTHAMYFQYTTGSSRSYWKMFRHKEATYALRNSYDGGAPSLYIVGDRGVADTSAVNTLVDASKTWTADEHIGKTVLIFNGVSKGEYRIILDNNATSLTIAGDTDSSSPIWPAAPDATSEYVIQGATKLTTGAIGTHGLTKTVTDIADAGVAVYFAQGDAAKMRHNVVSQSGSAYSTAWTADGSSTSVYADQILSKTDASADVKLWRILNTGGAVTISNATAKTAALETTDFTDAGKLENFEKPTNLLDYDGKVYALTAKNIYHVINNLVTKLSVGLDAIPTWENGIAAAVQNLYLYFSWSHSMERFYGTVLDDVGPWEDAGLPTGRTGHVSAIVPVVGWLICAINARNAADLTTGYSSVLVWNGAGWHEIWRGPQAAKAITSLFWEPIMGSFGRLWVGYDDDLIYMDFPLNTLNPTHDSTFKYNHEAHLITSWMDAGYAELPKYYREVSIRADNLGANTTVAVDYQTDDASDSTAWTNAGTASTSPQQSVTINVGDKKRIRLRFRLLTSVHTTPAKVLATVLKCFARTMVKYQYNVTFRCGHNQRTYAGLPDHNPDTLLNQLESWAESATPLTMRCVLSRMDNKTVIVEPPGIIRKTWNKVQSWFSGTATVVIREV